MESEYYDGTKLLSLRDINGNIPELYLVTTNRTAGKTTFFGRMLVNRFLKHGDKFALLYRFNYELKESSEQFFKDISELFFKGYEMTSKNRAHGKFQELFINDDPCGYAIALNDADAIKRSSHFFSDVHHVCMDEFQSETNRYCPEEVTKFLSIHKSIARGQGKQYRRVPVYMLGNTVTLLNPYYAELGIASRLKKETKFLRGKGFVMEQGYVEAADRAQEQSGVMQAFSSSRYVDYASQGVYLNDSESFIENMRGRSRYICTLRYKGTDFAVREYANQGIIYVDTKVDNTFPNKISITTADHKINYVMLARHDFFLGSLRLLFQHGSFRFKNQLAKEAILEALSYR